MSVRVQLSPDVRPATVALMDGKAAVKRADETMDRGTDAASEAANPPAATIRVLIADDHPIVREGLAALIERREDMTVAAQAENGQEALNLYQQLRPDVTLLDLRMPIMDGISTITHIREFAPDARLIVLTTFDGDEDIYQGLQAGAKAYLLKDGSRAVLLDTIRRVHQGETFIPSNVAAKLAQRIGQSPLTPRENDVLRLLVAGNSNQEIARTLFIAEGTVKAHVNSILDKMRVNDRTQAVISAIRRGIVPVESVEVGKQGPVGSRT